MLTSGGHFLVACQLVEALRRQSGEKDARIRRVIAVQKLAARSSRSPDDHFALAAHLGFVHFANERGNQMGVAGIVVVAVARRD